MTRLERLVGSLVAISLALMGCEGDTAGPAPLHEGLAETVAPQPVPTSVGLSKEQLSHMMFVASHPLNDFIPDWAHEEALVAEVADPLLAKVVADYRLEFFDRNFAFNAGYYRDDWGYGFELFERVNALGIPSATYYSWDQYDMATGPESFGPEYLDNWHEDDWWYGLDGALLTNPLEQGEAQNLDGSRHAHGPGNRTRFSPSNPNFLEYHKQSMRFHTRTVGARGFNWDFLNIGYDESGADGADFSDWAVAGFRAYVATHQDELEARFGPLGVDVEQLDIREHFATHTPAAPHNRHDPILKAFFLFSEEAHMRMVEALQAEARLLGDEVGAFMPVYGNLALNGRSAMGIRGDQAQYKLGRFCDVIHIELGHVMWAADEGRDVVNLPGTSEIDIDLNQQNERNFTTYKLGQAIGGHEKPVWILSTPAHEAGVGAPMGEGIEKRGMVWDASHEGIWRYFFAETYAAGARPEIDLGGWPGPWSEGTALQVTEWAEHVDGVDTVDTYPELVGTIAFLDEHRALFEGAESGARTAVVVSLPSMMWTGGFWGAGDGSATYTAAARALEHMNRVYDIVPLSYPDWWDDQAMRERLGGYDNLILARAPAMSEAQKRALGAFVTQGGHLFVVDGPLEDNPDGLPELAPPGGLDEHGSTSATPDWFADLVHNPGTGTVRMLDPDALSAILADGSGSFAELDRAFNDPTTGTAAPALVTAPDQDERAQRHLVVNAFDVADTTVVHLLNTDFRYNTDNGGDWTPMHDLRLELRGDFSAATLYDVDARQVTPLQATPIEGGIEVTVPNLHGWAWLQLE